MGSSDPPRLRLFHFSDDPAIVGFVPRPVTVPSERPSGMDWLNGPLVWAVSEERQATYLFPRDCPRIVLWRTPDTTEGDHGRWFGTSEASMVGYVEQRWLDRIRTADLHRYELPPDTFTAVDGDWMWVSERPVEPVEVVRCGDLLAGLSDAGLELRSLPSLRPLAGVWDTTLHASGIRLRNAGDWPWRGSERHRR